MILDKLDKLGIREKVGLVLAMVFLAALVIDRVIVRAMAERCRELEVKIRTLEGNVIENRGIVGLRDDVVKDYESIKGTLGQVVSADETIADLKGEIDDLARRHRIELQSMSHQEPVPAGSCEQYAVVVGNFESEFRNLVGFLSETTESPGMLRVNKLSVSPGKARDWVKGSMLITKVLVAAEKAAEKPAEQRNE